MAVHFLQFHNQQLERQRELELEATHLQEFHKYQRTEMKAREQAHNDRDLSYSKKNKKLLKVKL